MVTEECASKHTHHLTNISLGGFTFRTDSPIKLGRSITINIPLIPDSSLENSYVAWCRGKPGNHIVGVRLTDNQSAFRARMVQQICHIELYRRKIADEDGRNLSSDKAAREWIANYATDFP